jgi:hypothetical protein
MAGIVLESCDDCHRSHTPFRCPKLVPRIADLNPLDPEQRDELRELREYRKRTATGERQPRRRSDLTA